MVIIPICFLFLSKLSVNYSKPINGVTFLLLYFPIEVLQKGLVESNKQTQVLLGVLDKYTVFVLYYCPLTAFVITFFT